MQASSAEQCADTIKALNDAVLALERDLQGTSQEFRACRNELVDAEQRQQTLVGRLERCDQADTAARVTLEQAREEVRSCEVERNEQARTWAEERRRLAGEVIYLKNQLAGHGTAQDREGLIASLRVQLDEQRAQLDASLRALADAAGRIQAAALPPPAPLAPAGSIDERLARAAAERKELEALAATLFQRNSDSEAELRKLRQELERARGAAAGAAAPCFPADQNAALHGELSQCRAALDMESSRVAALSVERERLILERDALRKTAAEPARPQQPEPAPVQTVPPPQPPQPRAEPAIDCTVKDRDLGLRGVPAGTYRLSDIGLGDLAEGAPSAPITLARPLCLMTRGVTVAEFDAFVAAHSPAERKQLGLTAPQGDARRLAEPRDALVGVPWTVAEAYAEWLSKSTGRRFALPERNDWLAALAVWWNARRGDELAWTGARDLLSGRYDWSATACGRAGGKPKRTLMGRAEGPPPTGGLRDLCRDAELPPGRAGLRLKLLP